MKTLLALLVTAVAFSGNAKAQLSPYQITDNDLHAAYCLGASKTLLTDLGSSPSREVLQDRISRLQAYVLPKAISSDAATIGLGAASTRGQNDVAKLRSDDQHWACLTGCAGTDATPQSLQTCNKKCATPISDRIASCRDLSWLPF